MAPSLDCNAFYNNMWTGKTLVTPNRIFFHKFHPYLGAKRRWQRKGMFLGYDVVSLSSLEDPLV
jgi:hypothetical protein